MDKCRTYIKLISVFLFNFNLFCDELGFYQLYNIDLLNFKIESLKNCFIKQPEVLKITCELIGCKNEDQKNMLIERLKNAAKEEVMKLKNSVKLE